MLKCVALLLLWAGESNAFQRLPVPLHQQHHRRGLSLGMAMDDFLTRKLDGIKRTFDALTERLADPDVANDRKQMLVLSRERAGMEKTVEAYAEWCDLEAERKGLVEMDQSGELDAEMRDMVRGEQRELEGRMGGLEKSITMMLLPSDPNDDRNVMLEVRAGTGGDEASLWAGDLVTVYSKYAEGEGWRVEHISETEGEVGGYKTCVLQITGSYVYSKLKYEVREMLTVPWGNLVPPPTYVAPPPVSSLCWPGRCPPGAARACDGQRGQGADVHGHGGRDARGGRGRSRDRHGRRRDEDGALVRSWCVAVVRYDMATPLCV